MKIIAICGSSRKGNTEFVLTRMLMKADKLDAETDFVALRDKRIEYCEGCLECEKTGKCKIKDNMQDIYDRLEKSDIIIFGGPSYFGNFTGLAKNFIDRLRPYCTNGKLKEKKMVIVTVGEDDQAQTMNVVKNFEIVAEKLGLIVVGDLDFIAKGPRDVEENPQSMEKINNFIVNIIS